MTHDVLRTKTSRRPARRADEIETPEGMYRWRRGQKWHLLVYPYLSIPEHVVTTDTSAAVVPKTARYRAHLGVRAYDPNLLRRYWDWQPLCVAVRGKWWERIEDRGEITAKDAPTLADCRRCLDLAGYGNRTKAKEARTVPIRIDMEGVTSGGFEPIDEGVYAAKVKGIKYVAKSKSAGLPYLEWTFSLDEHPNRNFWHNTSLSPGALWSLKQMLTEAFGAEVPDGEFDFEPTDYVNRPCQLQVGIRDHWQGKRHPVGHENEGEIIKENEVVAVLAPADGQQFGWG
jgi:hypothetical protein